MIGLSLPDYEEITLAQLINAINGFYSHEKIKQEAEWKRINYMVYSNILISPDIKPMNKPKSFEAYLNGNKPIQLKPEQLEALLK